MEQTAHTSPWWHYHKSLYPAEANRFKSEIEKVLGLSQSAFYRKIKYPERFLTIAEKWAIARVYRIAETYLFPELDEVKG